MEKVDINEIKKALELSPVEGEIFAFILDYGRIKSVEIRKSLHLDRAQFYRALSLLESKGLVIIGGTARKQVVELEDIDNIGRVLHEKKSQIENAEKSLTDILTNLKNTRDDRYQRGNVEIISGKDAYLRSMQSVLKGGGKILRDITPDSKTLYKMAGSEQEYKKIVSKIKKERISKKIAIKILFDNQARVIDKHSENSQKDLKEVRMLDRNLKLDCYLNTCGTKTLFYTKDVDGSWGIIIKDELITKLLNSLFDVLWEQSKGI